MQKQSLYVLVPAIVLAASHIAFAATGQCYLNGKPVQCPQFLGDYGWAVAGLILLVFAVLAIYILIQFVRSWSTGKLSVYLGKFIFAPGETVQGKAILELKKPVQVNKGTVTLEKDVWTTGYRNGRRTTSIQTLPVVSIAFQTQESYPKGKSEAAFTIVVPENVLSTQSSGLQGAIGTAINLLEGTNQMPAKWFIKIDLATDKALLSTRSEIEITREATKLT